MQICIHRGSKQIGGSCVELESKGQRLLIDFGLPLETSGSEDKYLPEIKGLDGSDESLLGILISHAHLDHFGLLSHISQDVPVGMGPNARRILKAAAPFLPGNWIEISQGWDFKSGKTFDVGPFMITPMLMDHSAYDAYSFFIEAENKRIFYSGDIRGHGRKAPLFEEFVSKSHPPVDVLFLEGSTLGRLDENAQFPSESDMENEFIRKFRETNGMVLVHASAQNIDRIVSIFRACKKTKRKLIIDLYTAAILEATDNPRIPQSSWPDVVLYVPQAQRVKVKHNSMFGLLKKHSSNRVYIENLKNISNESVILFRPVHSNDLQRAECLKGAAYIYSLWEGYWERGDYDRLKNWLTKEGIPKTSIHTSGHASIRDLKRFAKALSPNKVIPIHTFMPERYPELFSNVEFHNDGEWWEI